MGRGFAWRPLTPEVATEGVIHDVSSQWLNRVPVEPNLKAHEV